MTIPTPKQREWHSQTVSSTPRVAGRGGWVITSTSLEELQDRQRAARKAKCKGCGGEIPVSETYCHDGDDYCRRSVEAMKP